MSELAERIAKRIRDAERGWRNSFVTEEMPVDELVRIIDEVLSVRDALQREHTQHLIELVDKMAEGIRKHREA